MKLRPSWVSSDANSTVHFDQFLHAFYYARVRQEREDEETLKSVELVERSFLRNRANPAHALREAAAWWASLDEAPYGEDIFIRDITPRMREEFAKEKVSTWTLDDFKRVFYDVHAFKMHARQVKNKTFSLPPGHSESIKDQLRSACHLVVGATSTPKGTWANLCSFLSGARVPAAWWNDSGSSRQTGRGVTTI